MSEIQKYFAAVERVEAAADFEAARAPLAQVLKVLGLELVNSDRYISQQREAEQHGHYTTALKELGLELVNSDGYISQQREAELAHNTTALNERAAADPFAVDPREVAAWPAEMRANHFQTLIDFAKMKKDASVDPVWERELGRAKKEQLEDLETRRAVRRRREKKGGPRVQKLEEEVARLEARLARCAPGGADRQEAETALFAKEAELERAEAEART